METTERKRNRAVADGRSQRRTSPAPLPPSEDEVEEFFAILRRINVAVKYFERSNVGLDGRELAEKLETEALPVVHDEDDDAKEIEKGNSNVKWDLDLNMIPEEESSSV